MEPNIELHLLNYRLKILSIKKASIHKLMHPLVKIGFTNKTKCSFFSFIETNDDYSIVVDNCGFDGGYNFSRTFISVYLLAKFAGLNSKSSVYLFLLGNLEFRTF